MKDVNRFTGVNLTQKMYDELKSEADALGLGFSAYIRLILAKRKKI